MEKKGTSHTFTTHEWYMMYVCNDEWCSDVWLLEHCIVLLKTYFFLCKAGLWEDNGCKNLASLGCSWVWLLFFRQHSLGPALCPHPASVCLYGTLIRNACVMSFFVVSTEMKRQRLTYKWQSTNRVKNTECTFCKVPILNLVMQKFFSSFLIVKY